MKKKQKGYTLIELLIAMSIGGAVLLVIVSSIFVVMQGRTLIAGKSIAMSDIDNAAHWLVRDLVQAQTTSLTPEAPPTSNLTMNWSDLTHWAGDNGTVEHSANYTLSGTQLLRNYDGEVTIIGRHLTDVGFSIDTDEKMFKVTLTSCPGMPGSAVTRTFFIQMRGEGF